MFKSNLFGIIGIAFALLGLGVAIYQDDIRSTFEPEPVEIQDRVLEKGAKLLGLDVQRETTRDWVTIFQFGFGFVGIILGVVSWVRNENHRVSSAAAALGVVAIAWQYVIIAFALAIIMLIVGSFS